jgi:hypothetical protein
MKAGVRKPRLGFPPCRRQNSRDLSVNEIFSLAEQSGLSDPRLPDEEDRPAMAGNIAQGRGHHGKFTLAPGHPPNLH